MLLFGTPFNIFDGGSIQKRFMSLLEIGYARRSLYGYGLEDASVELQLSSSELYDLRANPQKRQDIRTWRQHFAAMADLGKMNWTVDVPRDVSEMFIRYEQFCKLRAEEFSRYDTVEKSEMAP